MMRSPTWWSGFKPSVRKCHRNPVGSSWFSRICVPVDVLAQFQLSPCGWSYSWEAAGGRVQHLPGPGCQCCDSSCCVCAFQSQRETQPGMIWQVRSSHSIMILHISLYAGLKRLVPWDPPKNLIIQFDTSMVWLMSSLLSDPHAVMHPCWWRCCWGLHISGSSAMGSHDYWVPSCCRIKHWTPIPQGFDRHFYPLIFDCTSESLTHSLSLSLPDAHATYIPVPWHLCCPQYIWTPWPTGMAVTSAPAD